MMLPENFGRDFLGPWTLPLLRPQQQCSALSNKLQVKRQTIMAAPATAAPAAPGTVVIHHHYETVKAPEPGTAIMLDPFGPSYGTVHRNNDGHVTDVNGFNLSFGYSFKRYIHNVHKPVSVYRTVGSILAVVPHFEFGLDIKTRMA
jgi:hypothetical protein